MLLHFILLLSKKCIQYPYNFYGTDLYVNVCRGVFRTQFNIYHGASLQKWQVSFIIDIRLGFKYTSRVGFTVEKVYRMSIFIWYGQSRLQKFIICFLFLELIKNRSVWLFHDGSLDHKETSPLTCSTNKWTSLYMIEPPPWTS